MQNLRDYLSDIVQSLSSLDPYRIILFGSCANNYTSTSQDLDIALILDSDFMPKTFEDKMKLRIMVRNTIYDISEKIPIDLVVYTRSEYFKLVELKQPFIQVINSGEILYDKAG